MWDEENHTICPGYLEHLDLTDDQPKYHLLKFLHTFCTSPPLDDQTIGIPFIMPKSTDKGKQKASSGPPQTSSSIDEIFASSSTSSRVSPGNTTAGRASRTVDASGSSKTGTILTGSETSKKKKKKQLKKVDGKGGADGHGTGSESSSAVKMAELADSSKVETVVDPSSVVKEANTMEKQGKKKRSQAATEEDEVFRDSRGTRRKTEEGFLIYKEAELGIDPEAGGTPLCPFDCDCCF
ncbi:hypothetical protein BD324DRAFT_369359 [Kockovaella imperatae]|uniref:DUF1764-domain-containing protein n=1 Tax=Kockovaella imperatae TaxID=4999 RepID=A0A1Y1UM92_9TREE|nr:hypothetical protein BD324DRAFT_369359 [Kockovaella imperatae]ORX38614.1 hypothetical protein BD324DRAFT_369359 [Kockovaella imperatae]